MNDDFFIREESFIQTIQTNLTNLGRSLANSLNSNIVGNTAQFTTYGTINEGDPVFLRGDEKIESAFGKVDKYERIRPQSPRIVAISSTKAILMYEDIANTNYLTAQVLELNSARNSFTFGTPVVIVSQNPSRQSLVYDSVSNRIIFEYSYSTTSQCVVGSISGTTLTLGTPVSYQTGVASNFGTVTFDSNANRVIVFYTNVNDDRYRIGTVTAITNTITFATEGNLSIGAITSLGPAEYSPSDARILLVYNSTQHSSIQINSVTGTATKGVASTGSVTTRLVANEDGLIGYASSTGELRTYKINPTFNTTTVGPISTAFTGGNITYDSTTGGIFLLNGASVNTATIGASDNITIGTAQSYYTLTSSNEDIIMLGSNIIITFEYGAVSNALGYFIFNPSLPFVLFRYVGLSKASYSDSEIGSINFYSVNNNQSGLIPGNTYYLDQTDLTTEEKNIKIGRAISTTSIYIS